MHGQAVIHGQGRMTVIQLGGFRGGPAAGQRGRRRAPAGMRPAAYDAGMLVAAGRDAREAWADHQARLEAGLVPVVPAPSCPGSHLISQGFSARNR